MDIGVAINQTEHSIRPDRLAVEAEERGFGSVWFSEHTHTPTSRATPFPPGNEIPEVLTQLLDPFACLAAAAAVTQRIGLGTGVALIAQRDPIITAKEVSTIDYLSGGRVKVGVGSGWNREEAANHGIDPSLRWDIAREKVLAMKALWTQREAAYQGAHVKVESSWQWPKPVQRPHPPIYLGGAATGRTFDRVVEYCDGWIPFHGPELASETVKLRDYAHSRGRAPESVDVIPFVTAPGPDLERQLELCAELGVASVMLNLPSAPGPVVLDQLDRWQQLVVHWS